MAEETVETMVDDKLWNENAHQELDKVLKQYSHFLWRNAMSATDHEMFRERGALEKATCALKTTIDRMTKMASEIVSHRVTR